MSALAGRLRQLRITVEQRLPPLLVPDTDDERTKQQERELSELRDQLLRLIKDIGSYDYILRMEARNKSADAWAMKQRLANVKLEKDEAEGLAHSIENALKSKGLDPMKAGKEISELLAQFHLPTEKLNQLKEMLLHSGQHSQSIASPGAPHVDPIDAVSQLVVISSAMLSWVIKKRSDKRKKGRAA